MGSIGRLKFTFYRLRKQDWGFTVERNWWGEWYLTLGIFYLGIEWLPRRHYVS